MSERVEKTSEFGKGFVYPLVLFAMHFGRQFWKKSTGQDDYSRWINGSSDHLFGFDAPRKSSTAVKYLSKGLRDMALEWGHGDKLCEPMPKKEFEKLSTDLKTLALEIDKWLKVNPIKGDYE